MGGTADEEYEFSCPECDESLVVNESMKEALIAKGCVVCGADVSGDAFTLDHE